MPTYVYYCPQCDETVERNVRMEDRNYQDCYRCKGGLNKLIKNPAGIHIK